MPQFIATEELTVNRRRTSTPSGVRSVVDTAALERDKPKAERAAIIILEPEEAKAALAALEGHYLGL